MSNFVSNIKTNLSLINIFFSAFWDNLSNFEENPFAITMERLIKIEILNENQLLPGMEIGGKN